MRYDAFGNRKSQTPSGTGSAPQMNLPFTNPTNRVDPGNNIVYDAAGNVTTDNQGQTYTYDAEERISSMTHLGGTNSYPTKDLPNTGIYVNTYKHPTPRAKADSHSSSTAAEATTVARKTRRQS